jgi:diguanylate cyclase (GGDEF)-like protein
LTETNGGRPPDQATADSGRRAAQADKDAADNDAHASALDRAAADRAQMRSSPAPRSKQSYDFSRAERAVASAQREASGAARASTAVARTRQAAQRDEAARQRDLSALARDRAAAARDRVAERKETSEELTPSAAGYEAMRTAHTGARAARAKAGADRARAAADRARAAADRARAAEDRRHARIDLFRAHLDDLTGVYTRGWGLVTLQHEIDRAHRSGERFVLAFVDVDGLKQVNDRKGHAAGDASLRAVASVLKSNVRSYDPIVRVGGDEFICAFSNTALQRATSRLADIRAALEENQVDVSVSVGLAELAEGETLEHLTARGDAELYHVKQHK